MAAKLTKFEFVDRGGRWATMSFYTEFGINSAEMTTLATKAQAASSATLVWILQRNEEENDLAEAAEVSPYSVRDRLHLVFETAKGNKVVLSILGIAASVLTNDEVLNTGSALVIALKNAAIAAIGDKTGLPVERLVKAWRERGKTPPVALTFA